MITEESNDQGGASMSQGPQSIARPGPHLHEQLLVAFVDEGCCILND